MDCADPCSQTWDIWMHIFDVLRFFPRSQSKTGAVAKNDEKARPHPDICDKAMFTISCPQCYIIVLSQSIILKHIEA